MGLAPPHPGALRQCATAPGRRADSAHEAIPAAPRCGAWRWRSWPPSDSSWRWRRSCCCALVVTYPTHRAGRALPGRARPAPGPGRGVASRSAPATTRPRRPPQPRADGWYVHDNQLYRSPRMPAFMRQGGGATARTATYVRDWVWLAFTPFAGGLAAALPLALLAAGVAVAVGATGLPWSPAVAARPGWRWSASGWRSGRSALRLHARWSRMLLRPRPGVVVAHAPGSGPGSGAAMLGTWHGAGLAGMGAGRAGHPGLLHLVATVISWGGLYPFVVSLTRPYLDHYRRRAAEWTGGTSRRRTGRCPSRPAPTRPGATGSAGPSTRPGTAPSGRSAVLGGAKDPATWRDLLWTVTNAPVGLLGLIPAVLVAVGFYGLVWQPIWWAPWAVPIGLADGVWVTPWYMWYGAGLRAPGPGRGAGLAQPADRAGGRRWSACCWPDRCCAAHRRTTGGCSAPTRADRAGPPGAPADRDAGRRRSTPRRPSCAGSSGTCTTARRPGWSRSA